MVKQFRLSWSDLLSPKNVLYLIPQIMCEKIAKIKFRIHFEIVKM